MVRIIAALASLCFGLVAYWYLAPRSSSFGMFEGAEVAGLWRFALSFLATIAGVICGSFYRELRGLQAKGVPRITNPRGFLGDMFRSVDMWLGFAGSPIVYSLLLKATDGMSLPGLIVVALQNGFCCLIIVNGFVGRAEQADQELSKKLAQGKAEQNSQEQIAQDKPTPSA
jgi:hypothetical protein